MSKVKVEGLTKVFGPNPKRALPLIQEGLSKDQILEKTGLTVGVNDCSFEVEEGELFVIMGLSGSGKSTLIRLVNRIIEPTSGNIFIDDEELSAMDEDSMVEARRQKMSMVFQNFALFPHYTILQNASYGLDLKGVAPETAQKKAREALSLVGLEGYEDQYPDQLSGGMQQRVGLARALATDTDIIIMDEAFSALDPLIRKEMQDELLVLQTEMKKTILFITHDLNEALKLGDRIALMKDGEIVQIDPPEELLSSPANDFVRDFVQDVDRSKVLTAESVMIRPDTINISKHGPKTALAKMRSTGNSSIYVVNNTRELQGYVTAEDAAESVKEGKNYLDGILQTDMIEVGLDHPVDDIVEKIRNLNIPITVVEDRKLKGIIIKGTVLSALAGQKIVEDVQSE